MRTRGRGRRQGWLTQAGLLQLTALSTCLLVPWAARAEDPSLELTWRAPKDCPQEPEVRARIEGYLGGSNRSREQVIAEASIGGTSEHRYQLRLRITTSKGQAERSLSAESCAAVAQAAALLIAMAVDPNIAGAPESKGAAPGPSATPSAPPPKPEARSERAASEASNEPTEPALGVEASAMLDVGSMPGAGLGFSGQAEARFSWLRLGLGGQLFIPSEGSISQLPTATVDISAAMATARACGTWRLGPSLELGPCVWGELGELRGRAEGIRRPFAGSALWLALGTALQSRFALGPHFKLDADAGLIVPHARRRFLVQSDQGTLAVHRVAAAALRFGLGISYEF
jgi:hypothetical protein